MNGAGADARKNVAVAADPVRTEYDRLAASYDRRWQTYVDRTLAAVVAWCDLRGDERLLDAPAGTGELLLRLLARWPSLTATGIDISRQMLRVARGKAPLARVPLVQADVHALPFADEAFDACLCVNSFHYFRDPSRALAEMRRVLAPGGRLIVVDWCEDYLACRACGLWLRWTDPAHRPAYTLSACRERFGRAGLNVVRANRFRISWLWGLMRLEAVKPV